MNALSCVHWGVVATPGSPKSAEFALGGVVDRWSTHVSHLALNYRLAGPGSHLRKSCTARRALPCPRILWNGIAVPHRVVTH